MLSGIQLGAATAWAGTSEALTQASSTVPTSAADGFWGVLAVVQMIWLPGLAVTSVIRVPGLLARLMMIVVASLWVNSALVLVLAPAGLMNRGAILLAMAIEAGIVLLARPRGSTRAAFAAGPAPTMAFPWRGHTRLFGALAAVALAMAAGIAVQAVGTMFTGFDAIASWNRWATEWAFEGFPKGVREYPQLLPSVWSVSYAMLGHPHLWHFAKSIQGVFPLLACGGLFAAGWTRRSAVWLGAVAVGFLLLVALYRPLLVSGFQDVPVAALVAVAIGMVYRAGGYADAREAERTVLWGAVAAAAAGLCKPGGLLLVVAFPLLVATCPLPVERRARRRLIVKSMLLMFLMLAPWYGTVGWLFANDELKLIGPTLVEGMAVRPSAWGRLVTAFEHLAGVFSLGGFLPGAWVAGAVLAAVIAGLVHPESRLVTLIVALPFWLVWAFGFSYSTRNMSVAVPAMSVAICGAAAALLRLRPLRRIAVSLLRRLSWLRRWLRHVVQSCRTALRAASRAAGGGRRAVAAVGLAIALPLAAAAGGWLAIDPAALAEAQLAQRREIGDPTLNRRIYAADAAEPIAGLIASSYAILRHLPGFEFRTTFLSPNRFVSFERAWYSPSIGGFVVRDSHFADDPRIMAEIRRLARAGHVRIRIEQSGWVVATRPLPARSEIPRLRYSMLDPPLPLDTVAPE